MDYTKSKRLEHKFCGLTFENPFMVAASPTSDGQEKIKKALAAGWSGVVFKTTTLPQYITPLVVPYILGIDYKNQKQMGLYNCDLISQKHVYIIADQIKEIKAKFPTKIMSPSIMASEVKDWVLLIDTLAEAGADMVEMCMSCPQGEQGIKGEAEEASLRIPSTDAKLMYETIKAIKANVKHDIPLVAKLTPNVTDIAPVAKAAYDAGIDAVCTIDTLRGFCGVDIETGLPKLRTGELGTWGGLSGPMLKPVTMAIVTKILTQYPEIPLEAVGGITTWEDAVEFLLLGASLLQVCTAISMYGVEHINALCKGLDGYMEKKGYNSIDEMKGKSLKYITDVSNLSISLKVKVDINEETCIKCGKCAKCCQDFGFGALSQEKVKEPIAINLDKCLGCGACSSVCPTNSIRYK